MRESDFETILAKYPDMIDGGLRLLGRQVTMFGRRMDLLFEDRFNRKLIIELKVGPIKDEHIGQVPSYEGMLLSADDPTVRVMLIGNRVPPNIQRALDHHGIAWREITFSVLRDHLRGKGDIELLSLVGEEAAVKHEGIQKIMPVSSITVESVTAPQILSDNLKEKFMTELLHFMSRSGYRVTRRSRRPHVVDILGIGIPLIRFQLELKVRDNMLLFWVWTEKREKGEFLYETLNRHGPEITAAIPLDWSRGEAPSYWGLRGAEAFRTDLPLDEYVRAVGQKLMEMVRLFQKLLGSRTEQ